MTSSYYDLIEDIGTGYFILRLHPKYTKAAYYYKLPKELIDRPEVIYNTLYMINENCHSKVKLELFDEKLTNDEAEKLVREESEELAREKAMTIEVIHCNGKVIYKDKEYCWDTISEDELRFFYKEELLSEKIIAEIFSVNQYKVTSKREKYKIKNESPAESIERQQMSHNKKVSILSNQ